MPSTAKQKALCVATRCTTAQQFIETFHRFCDEQSFFVATMNMRQVGLETPFSIQLADKTPVLQGLCVVLAASTTSNNQFKRPGIRLGIRRLTPESEAVFYQLQAMRTAAPQEVATEASEAVSETPVPIPLPPIPTMPRVSPPPPPRAVTPRAGSVVIPPAKVKEEERTPGSELVLPANPLQGLNDESLEGFVDCTIYEETGNFFGPAPEDFQAIDEPAPPPKPAEPVPALPDFNPASVIASAFPVEDTNEPTRDRSPRAATPTVESPNPFRVETQRAEPPPPPPPVEVVARVEPVAKLAETPDTSRPIDEVARATPLPAGEAYAREASSRSKWIAVGGIAIAASVAVVLFVVTRSSSAEEPAPAAAPTPAPTKPVAAEPPPKPVDDPKPVKPDEVNVDGDEIAAIADPTQPVTGEGPCKLDITTTPAGTSIQLDGQTIGPSPLTIAGPCTRRRVDLVHPRYKAEQRWVNLAEDKPNKLDVTLVRPTHTLTVTSQPAGATVYIAGRRAGTTPTKVQLMGFSGLDVKVEKNGFETVSKRIYSKVPQDSFSVTLKRSLWLKK